jgi:hypothetical protein
LVNLFELYDDARTCQRQMPFVMICRTWKAWFQVKENKKKEPAKLERKKEGKIKKTIEKGHSM